MLANEFYLTKLFERSDIVCVQEHWLYQFQLPDLDSLLNCHSHGRAVDFYNPIPPKGWLRGHGGVVIIWHEEMNPYITKQDDGNERVVVCTIQRLTKKPICLINVYMPSGHSKKTADEYRKTLAVIQEAVLKYGTSHDIVIAGDFNHDLFNRRDPNRGNLIQTLNCCELSVLSDGIVPTMISNCGRFSSHIDLFMTNNQQLCVNPCALVVEKTPDNSSAHTPILIDIRSDEKCVAAPVSTSRLSMLRKPQWRSVSIDRYQELVAENLEGFDLNLISPDAVANIIQLAVTDATNTLMPPRRQLSRARRHKPWTKPIADAVRRSKLAHMHWKDLGKPGKDHPTAKARRKASRAVRTAQRVRRAVGRKKFYSDVNKAAKSNDKAIFHKLIKRQRSTKLAKTVIVVNDKQLHDPHEAANAYGEHFRNLATPAENPLFDDSLMNLAQHDLHSVQEMLTSQPLLSQGTLQSATNSSVLKAISSLNKGKAPDNNGVTAEHFQHAKHQLVIPLKTLFNKINSEKAVPSCMKEGRKLPIPKKGKDPTDCNNSRGITITSQLGKLQESHIRASNNIPTSQHALQFGFTKDCTPQLAALCVTETLAEAADLKIPLYIASFDATKAFDVVSHTILFRKLLTNGTPGNIVEIIRSLYTDCEEIVLWNGATSDPYVVKQGVRQGGVISADLYKLYIDGLLHRISSKNLGFAVGTAIIGAAGCADDIVLIAMTTEDLQQMVDEVAWYARTHRYLLHPVKSIVSARGDTPPESIILNDKSMTCSNMLSHLGIDRDLSKKNMMHT